MEAHDASTSKRYQAAAQEAQATIAKQAARIAALEQDAARLRYLLFVRIAGLRGYSDDGEMQDATAHPGIDFKRDTVAEIEEKLIARGIANFCKEASAAIEKGGA